MDSEKERMRLQLCKLIEDWNANRLDLFALSQPNEELEFHGVMRFFFQESGQKVATKCIRVSSTATTRAVIDALIEKFHPDLRMLSTPKYSLWEVHENGEERQLRMDEKPLLVQLNWHKDDREGRFLLRRDGVDYKNAPLSKELTGQVNEKQMKRKLSKREKKEQKKKEKRAVREAEDASGAPSNLYAEVPPTTFTRTISNPEIVMKKRRERKLAEKLKNIGDGGSLKIYGEEVSGGSKPYVTLLVSITDRADRILREALEKYGIDYQRYGGDYYLAEVRSPLVDDDEEVGDELEHQPGQPQTERALDDDDCPLLIYANDTNRANITFHVRRKTPAVAREVETRRKSKSSLSDSGNVDQQQPRICAPCLIELNSDGIETGRRHFVQPNVTELGSDRTLVPPYGLQIHGHFMHPRHCVLAFMDGVVTITPCSSGADLKIDERTVSETTVLNCGQIVRIGQTHLFSFVDATSVNGRHQNSHPTGMLDRTPSVQGMVRSVSTPTRSPTNTSHQKIDNEMGLAVEGHRFATTFDVDGDVKTVIVSVTLPQKASPSGDVRASELGGGVEFDLSTNKPATSGVDDTPSLPLTPNAHVGDGQPKNVQHYPEPPATVGFQEPPAEKQPNRRYSPAPSSPHQTRTPPVFPRCPQSGPARPSALFGRDVIPAIIELLDNAEDDFLSAILRDTKADRVTFKLAPAYVVYMCCRYRVSPHYRTGISPEERTRRLTQFLSKVVGRMHVTIQDHCHEAMPLAFWMANCSELLNFTKLDAELNSATSPEPQESMADAVQKAYDHLVAYFKQELHAAMPTVLDLDTDDHSATSLCIHMLSGAMSVLRLCRVNAALTIQIFSQLFHYINMYLFNWLVSREGGTYCVRRWGIALRRRLANVQAWSEKQGLEAAADARLERILQTSQLLQIPKTPENFVMLCAATSKLNSLQIRSILERYRSEMGEPAVDRDVLENLVKLSEEQVDEVARMEGQTVQLEEELDLQLPFLLPDDGYSPQVVRGIPNGLREYVEQFLQRSICRMIHQPTSSGSWTVHMAATGSVSPINSQGAVSQAPALPSGRSGSLSSNSNLTGIANRPPSRQGGPEVVHISFQKGDGGIGLSIIQAQGVGQTHSGIYVKNVVPGSSAARDGRLEAGDQLLKVNGQSLVGISQEAAAKIMGGIGPTVHFEVAKRAVSYNGLAEVIYQQSPDVSRRVTPTPAVRSPNAIQTQMNSGRVRSVEQLSQKAPPQYQQNHPNVQPTYSNVPSQPRQPDQVHHQRYPSSGSIQHAHYYQQQQQHQHSVKMGPPPVQYQIQQQQRRSPTHQNHARSMSASNLKEDAPTPTEVRRHFMQQRQQQQPQQHQNVDSFVQRAPTVFPPASGQASFPHRLDEQRSIVDEQYYQNLSQYQTQERYSVATGSVARRMSASDYTGSVAAPAAQRQQSTGMLASAYANQEYHRLPHEQQAFSIHRAPQNAPAYREACNASASSADYPVPLSASSASHQHHPHDLFSSGHHQQGTVNHRLTPSYQNNLDNPDLSQVPWQRPGTPSAYDGSVSPPVQQQQQHSRHGSYQQELTQQFTNQLAGLRRKEMPPIPQRAPSVSMHDPQRYRTQTPTMDHLTRQEAGLEQQQQSFPLQMRVGQEAAAVAATGIRGRSVEEEEREKQVQDAIERLIREEVGRLESKEQLNEDEQRRYRALRFELEYRRRLDSVNNDNAQEQPMVKVETEFDDILHSLEPASNVTRRDQPSAVAGWRNSAEQGEEMGMETSVQRQQIRDRYFEEAEQRYREAAVRQRQTKGNNGEMELEGNNGGLSHAKPATRDSNGDATAGGQSDPSRIHINELQAKLQEMNVGAEEQKPRDNGYQSAPFAPAPPPPPPPLPPADVPPKRKVVFSDGSETEISAASMAQIPQSPTSMMEQQAAPKKYVYDETPEDQQPRARVIGGQEVYRDPRQERLKNMQQRKLPAETEKLSFKDKMRLFAAEIGESTPKEKVKVSSAQREIEGARNGSSRTLIG